MPRSASTQQRSKELTRLSRAEFALDQADTLAFADRNREIVELPAGLENGLTRKRMRGARTDCDCIDEICEIVAQGITATAIFIDKAFSSDGWQYKTAIERACSPCTY
jgi:hypothetical protein